MSFGVPRSWLPLAAIIALAGMVHCEHLAELSYDFDEAFCWKMTTFPASEIWARSALDNHPPLYFYLLWAWSRAFGDSPEALRSLSVVFGLATVVGAYLLVRQIGSSRIRENSGEGSRIRENSGELEGGPLSAASRPHPGPLAMGDGGGPDVSQAPLPELSRVPLPAASELPALVAAALAPAATSVPW